MINPPPPRYPGPGRPPTSTQLADYMQAADLAQTGNGADGGTVGLTVDSAGSQVRLWGTDSILARITGRGAGNSYSWREVYVPFQTGVAVDVPGGLTGTTTDNPAFEVNFRTDVPNTIVELWPNYSPAPYWTFTFGGVTAGSGSGSVGGDLVTVCFTDVLDVDVSVTATCSGGVITTTTTTTVTMQEVCITGPDLSISTRTV